MLDNECTVAHLSYALLHHEIVHPFCQQFQLLQGIQKHALMSDNAKCSCTETCALHLHINRYAISNARESERERESDPTCLTEQTGHEGHRRNENDIENSQKQYNKHACACMCMLVSAWLQTTRPNCRPGPRIVLEPGSRSRSNLNYSRDDEQNAQFGQRQSAEAGSATSPFIKLTTHCIHFSSRLPDN